MSERVALVYGDMNINDSYHIEGWTTEIKSGGMQIDQTWDLQEAVGKGWTKSAHWTQFQWAP